MCGRFVSTTAPAVLAERFQATVIDPDADAVPASWNVAPTDVVNAVVYDRGQRRVRPLRWGLVPSWASDPTGGARMINARVETVDRARAFRLALARRRCLVPADGFYEWRRRSARPSAFYFRRRDGDLLALAGLWELWRDAGGQWLATCSVVTTDATEPVAEIHDRMPVVLDPDEWDEWLDPDALGAAGARELAARLQPGSRLERWAVSAQVNSVRNNFPELIEPRPERSADLQPSLPLPLGLPATDD
jgi:putative SOS response-associated peptidase YedK